MGECFPWLVDSFRAAHPTRRAFTHHSPTSARRLDRLYVTGDLQPYMQACFMGDETPSDHRPVVLCITTGYPRSGERRARAAGSGGERGERSPLRV
jgi:exonuclease III